MSYWPSDLLEREFRPRHVEELTGHLVDTQRKWGEKFDFSRTSDIFRDRQGRASERPSRWWSWQGVQMISVFGDVLKDTGDHRFARAAVMRDRKGGGLGDIFNFDWRNRPAGDLLTVTDFAVGHALLKEGSAPHFSTTSADTMASLFTRPDFVSPERLYCYNISAMQRRLFSALEVMDTAE